MNYSSGETTTTSTTTTRTSTTTGRTSTTTTGTSTTTTGTSTITSGTTTTTTTTTPTSCPAGWIIGLYSGCFLPLHQATGVNWLQATQVLHYIDKYFKYYFIL